MYTATDQTERHARVVQQMERLSMIRRILYRRVMEEFPLHPGQLPILEYVGEHPGCTQVEVAQSLFITPSSIAQSTKRMQKEGLLEKHVRDENQRSKQLYVTARGAEVAQGCRKGFDEADRMLFGALSDDELSVMEGYATRMMQAAAARASLDVEHLDFSAWMRLKHCDVPHKHDGGKKA